MTATQRERDKEESLSAAKQKAARVSLFTVGVLILMKALASVYTGSIGIRADAVHSTIDLVAVMIGFIGIRISGKPADDKHEFGHDKAENIAGTVVAGLISVAAIMILYEAIRRLIYGGAVELITLGIYVTVAALVINVVLARYVSRAARVTDSIALEATARDILADALSSVAVLVGLLLVQITGLNILDPIAALIVAALILRTAYRTMRKSVAGLMDAKLPEAEELAIRSRIMEHSDTVVGFHKLRTRKAGSRRFIELHLVFPRDANLEEAHSFCDHLEEDIAAKLQLAAVTIHMEPCDAQCDRCGAMSWCTARTGDGDITGE